MNRWAKFGCPPGATSPLPVLPDNQWTSLPGRGRDMSPEPATAAIGIDLGGTYTRAALVDGDGTIQKQRREPTLPSPSAEALFEHLARIRAGLTPSDAAIPIGVAIPGTLDRSRTGVVRSVRFPVLEGRPVANELARRLGEYVLLLTDAEAATWGEFLSRNERAPRFVHLRLGTGIACGLVLDGALQRLDAQRTTHLEALVVDRTPLATPCRCGLRGCLETIASGAALETQARHIGLTDGVDGLREGWRQRRPEAVQVIERAASALSVALRNLIETFTPDRICIGGGVADHLPELVDEARSRFEAGESTRQTAIEPARLGDNAGVTGAARLALDR